MPPQRCRDPGEVVLPSQPRSSCGSPFRPVIRGSDRRGRLLGNGLLVIRSGQQARPAPVFQPITLPADVDMRAAADARAR